MKRTTCLVVGVLGALVGILGCAADSAAELPCDTSAETVPRPTLPRRRRIPWSYELGAGLPGAYVDGTDGVTATGTSWQANGRGRRRDDAGWRGNDGRYGRD